MINIQNISLHNDGQAQRISISWDEIGEDGSTISTNRRITRVIMDADVMDAVEKIAGYANSIITEVE